MGVVTYPGWALSKSMLVKRGPRLSQFKQNQHRGDWHGLSITLSTTTSLQLPTSPSVSISIRNQSLKAEINLEWLLFISLDDICFLFANNLLQGIKNEWFDLVIFRMPRDSRIYFLGLINSTALKNINTISNCINNFHADAIPVFETYLWRGWEHTLR